MQKMNEEGVSEAIGAVLLIGLTVVGITLISVLLFSQPIAKELPAVDVLISSEDATILFQHNGGDSLYPADFNIYIDGNAVPSSWLNFTDDGEWPWSVGETLEYAAAGTVYPLDEHIRITYQDNSGMFRPAFVDDVGIALADESSAPLPTLSPGVVPGDISPAEAGGIVAESVLKDSHIITAFTALEKDAVITGRYLNFTVASDNCTINIPAFPSVGNLNRGDEVVILTAGNQQASGNRISIMGVGHTFFSLRFEKVNVWINGVPITQKNNKLVEAEIVSGWIPKFKDLESNLAFRMDTPYELYIDGVLDPRSGTTTEFTLDNVRPTESGMFIINAWSPLDNENSVILAKADIVV